MSCWRGMKGQAMSEGKKLVPRLRFPEFRNSENALILYTSEDGRSQVKLRADQQTVWLTQLEMAELFDATKQNISLHLKNIFQDAELNPAATVKESLTVQTEGARQVQRPVTLYNLDAILAVGYRVRSPRGAQFRR